MFKLKTPRQTIPLTVKLSVVTGDPLSVDSWGREIQYRGATWIMGDRINIKAHPWERAIAVAQYKIDWGLEKLDRTMPYVLGERRDPSWGIEYYQHEAKNARSLLLEGVQESERLGVAVNRDRIQASLQKLDKIWEQNR